MCMGKVRTILLSRSMYADNDIEADKLRDYLRSKRTFLINVMSSPGSGKTTTLISLINELKNKYCIGVMEADIDSDIDANKVANSTNVKSIQLHTGGMCHIDAGMSRRGLDEISIDDLDIVFLENVGNLVCPAEFDTGSSMNMTILSIPEGDDKPLKYPLVFEKTDLVVINKIDALPFIDFSKEKCEEYIRMRNKNTNIIYISAKKGDGIKKLAQEIDNKICKWLKGE